MRQTAQNRVLLLNKTYEPLATMSVAQTMRKLSKKDSTLEVVEWDDDRVLHTTKGDYPVPSVVRLSYYLDIIKRRNKSGAKRLRIYQRDKFTCQYCNLRVGQFGKHLPIYKTDKNGDLVVVGHGRKMTIGDITLDHIFPRSKGGATRPDNLVTACIICNHRKADRTPEEARMPLLTPQSLLKVHLDRLLLCQYAEYRKSWAKYLFLDPTGEPALQNTGTND